MNKQTKKPRNEEMYRAILTLKTVDECISFFEDLCTISEIKSLAQRLQIADLLYQGKTYAEIFEITGVSYDKNKDKKGYFRDDAPDEIKALAKNLNDRTNPLWDRAMQYINEPEFVYEVRQARLIER